MVSYTIGNFLRIAFNCMISNIVIIIILIVIIITFIINFVDILYITILIFFNNRDIYIFTDRIFTHTSISFTNMLDRF